eukprot:Rmarinus@m.28486
MISRVGDPGVRPSVQPDPPIKVGGRLQFFVENWRRVNPPQRLLSILREGLWWQSTTCGLMRGRRFFRRIEEERAASFATGDARYCGPVHSKRVSESVQRQGAGVDLTAVSGREERGQVARLSGSAPPQPAGSLRAFQDGGSSRCKTRGSTGRFHDEGRYFRRVFSRTGTPEQTPVSSVLMARRALRVSSAPIWAEYCPAGIHKTDA